MKNTFIIAILGLMSLAVQAAPTSAPGFCSNYAKSGAIRAYKAEMGTVQGSDGIQYTAKLATIIGDVASYVVSISDNNEDGERWTVDYSVQVQRQGTACKVLHVKKLTP